MLIQPPGKAVFAVQQRAGLFLVLAGIAGQQGVDVFRTAHAVDQLAETVPKGP